MFHVDIVKYENFNINAVYFHRSWLIAFLCFSFLFFFRYYFGYFVFLAIVVAVTVNGRRYEYVVWDSIKFEFWFSFFFSSFCWNKHSLGNEKWDAWCMCTLQLYYPINWRAFSTIYFISIHPSIRSTTQNVQCADMARWKWQSIHIPDSRSSSIILLLLLWRRTQYKMLHYYISLTLWFDFWFDSIFPILVVSFYCASIPKYLLTMRTKGKGNNNNKKHKILMKWNSDEKNMKSMA